MAGITAWRCRRGLARILSGGEVKPSVVTAVINDGAQQECVRWRRKGGGRGFSHWPKNRGLSSIRLDWMTSSIWGPRLGNNHASFSRESVSHQLLNLLPTPCARLWLFQGAQMVNSISHEPLPGTDSTNVPNLR